MHELIERFLAHIDVSKTRISGSPQRIAVFGGPSGKRKGRFKSARGVFLSDVLTANPRIAERILTPEQYPEWNQFGVFQNLVEFEEELAYLTVAVLLFLESPGAIAELGVFSQIPQLRHQLYVVLNEHHYNESSFIRLGPLAQLKADNRNSVLVFPYSEKRPQEIVAHLPLLYGRLESVLVAIPASEQFQPALRRSQLLLIADLVEIFGVLQPTELEVLLKAFSVSLDHGTLSRSLFLLRRLQLIDDRQYGTNRYLCATARSTTFLDIDATTGGPPFNRLRFRVEAIDTITRDSSRRAMLHAGLNGLASKGKK